MTHEWTLDRICGLTKKPSVLNALHACRPGHPWNKTTERPWFNAYFLLAQQPSYVVPGDAIAWMEIQVKREAVCNHTWGGTAADGTPICIKCGTPRP